jgi:hypothetical protein
MGLISAGWAVKGCCSCGLLLKIVIGLGVIHGTLVLQAHRTQEL